MKKIFLTSLLFVFAFGCGANNEFTSTTDFYSVVSHSYEQSSIAKKVDIIFVVDNSPSMDLDQENISNQFQNFTSSLSEADYRIGFINTDSFSHETYNKEGFWGNLKSVGPNGEKFLASYMSNLPYLFKKAVTNQVTSKCIDTGECFEKPMRSLMHAIEKRDNENWGFFREGASFATIILTDEDESAQDKKDITEPEEYMNFVSNELQMSEDDITNFVITIPPGDRACLEKQKKESYSGTGAQYGHKVWRLAQTWSGFGVSICHPNFGSELRKISKYLEGRLLYQSILLDPAPSIRSSIKVKVIDENGRKIPTKWKLTRGKWLKLIPTPPANSKIDIQYKKKVKHDPNREKPGNKN